MIYDVAAHTCCTGSLLDVQTATHAALEKECVEIQTLTANARPASIIVMVSQCYDITLMDAV